MATIFDPEHWTVKFREKDMPNIVVTNGPYDKDEAEQEAQILKKMGYNAWTEKFEASE